MRTTVDNAACLDQCAGALIKQALRSDRPNTDLTEAHLFLPRGLRELPLSRCEFRKRLAIAASCASLASSAAFASSSQASLVSATAAAFAGGSPAPGKASGGGLAGGPAVAASPGAVQPGATGGPVGRVAGWFYRHQLL